MTDERVDEELEWDEEEIRRHVQEMEETWKSERERQKLQDRPVIPAIPSEEVKP